jgi:hypothetical protein
MPNTNPNLGSFLNASQFSSNVPSGDPLYAAIVAGSTFVLPSFNGSSGAAEKDPGGLFGWLIYARNYKTTPPKGTTGDSYLVYTNPGNLINDLNKLTGVTHCLISYTGSGGTFGFFQQTSDTQVLVRAPLGNDFLHCLHYLAYGGNLIISGTTSGLNNYENQSGNPIDVLIGNSAGNSSVTKWLDEKVSTVGIFPSSGDGTGTTAQNFTTYLGGSIANISDRVFNIYGLNGTTYTVTTLQNGGQLEYSIPAIADVAGAFNITKNLDQYFLTVGGLDRSTLKNKQITNLVSWNSALKTTLKLNRVNFYVNYSPAFLGSDLVGATGSASAPTTSERIGPSNLKNVLEYEVTQIGTKYLFELNIQSTRDSITAEINTLLDRYAYAILRSQAQVICNDDNNDDYSSTLNIQVIVRPLLSIDEFVINVTLEA